MTAFSFYAILVRMNEDLIFSRNEAAVAEPFLRRMKNLLGETDYEAYLLSLKQVNQKNVRRFGIYYS